MSLNKWVDKTIGNYKFDIKLKKTSYIKIKNPIILDQICVNEESKLKFNN